MKYKVKFNHGAIRDIEASFEWGLNNWGEGQALKWLRGSHTVIHARLSKFPLSCAVAPESAASDFEIRQLVYDRYRILYTVRKNEIRVIHLRGPYHGE
jgi:plasmid stabilization system protein ParE